MKSYYNITEISEKYNISKNILRSWEKEIIILKPRRMRGRRYYNQTDIAIIEEINNYLTIQQLSLKEVKNILNDKQENIKPKITTKKIDIEQIEKLQFKLLKARNVLQSIL